VKQAVFRVALIQMQCAPEPRINLEKAEKRIRQAASEGARIICLPELFLTHYFCQEEDSGQFRFAEPVPGPTTKKLRKLARELETVLIVPIFERRMAGVYHNTAAVIDADGELLGCYRKLHIPDDPRFYEKYYFSPGDLGVRCFDTRYARIGVLICWDQWFPETARMAALGGAQILFYPTAIGHHHSDEAEARTQQAAWQTVQRGHAIANGVYVAAVNRTGFEEGPPGQGLQFWGGSFIADPQGKLLGHARAGETTVFADCDPRHLETVRQNWPFLRDRRIDAYRPILNRVTD
jgi:N-carbamoylputrescine amidase